jgi:hypothetical protein
MPQQVMAKMNFKWLIMECLMQICIGRHLGIKINTNIKTMFNQVFGQSSIHPNLHKFKKIIIII